MTTTRMFVLAAFAAPLLCMMVESATVTVYRNGRIYTSSNATTNTFDTTMAVDDTTGIITALGASQVGVISAVSKVVDLHGQLVVPGLHDVHLHAVEAGINAQLCYIPPDTWMGDVPEILLYECEAEGQFGGQGWSMGAGIDIAILLEIFETDANEALPIAYLDEAFPDRPVVILDNIGHGAVVNSEALRRVGLLEPGSDPPGGEVLRLDDGTPIGIVTENTQQIFRNAAFPPTPENQDIAYESLLDALQILNRNGITSVMDAGGYWRQAQTEAWGRALEEGKLTVRASNALYIFPDTSIEEQLPDLLSRYSNDADSRLRFNVAKIYVDGILGLTTAALYEPYEASLGLPEDKNLGFEYFGTQERLQHVASTLADNGFQLHFHVVGDRAAGMALDVLAGGVDPTPGPHRLTHCFLIDAADRSRLAELGVIADFQLAPSSVDLEYQDFLASDIIGAERARQLMPITEVFDAGATVTVSSDWDADELSPLVKLQVLLNRPDGRSFERLEDVLPFLTSNAARLLRQEETTGSIAVGKYADLVVLDKDIFALPTNEIASAKVMLTLLQGQVVYNATEYESGGGYALRSIWFLLASFVSLLFVWE